MRWAIQPPEFSSAGAHFNPAGKKHGMQATDGPHAGDLPNLTANDIGEGGVDVVNKHVTLGPGANSLLGENGTAIVIHAAADDNKTDPPGTAAGASPAASSPNSVSPLSATSSGRRSRTGSPSSPSTVPPQSRHPRADPTPRRRPRRARPRCRRPRPRGDGGGHARLLRGSTSASSRTCCPRRRGRAQLAREKATGSGSPTFRAPPSPPQRPRVRRRARGWRPARSSRRPGPRGPARGEAGVFPGSGGTVVTRRWARAARRR